MSESKDYISRSDELGNIHISEDVLAVIAAAAALEVEGVGSLSANLGTDLVEMLGGKKNLSKGVRLSVEDGNITVDLSIMVKYGYVVPEVAKQVQDGVHTAIENMSGLTPACVNVHVAVVTFEKESRHA